MDGRRVPTPPRGDHRGRHGKASPGIKVVERDGYWHIHGTCRVGGRSVRVRRSTELPARPELREQADAIRLRIEQEIRQEVIHGVKPSIAVALAARDWLTRPRERSIGSTDIWAIKKVTRKFGTRMLREIGEDEWDRFVTECMTGRAASTRERFLNSVLAFLGWCAKRPRRWLDELPAFDRNSKARNPNTRARRRIEDVDADLIHFMLSYASPHLKAQLLVEQCTGARVSSILHGCRLCDIILADDRAQITFHDTKNGEAVTAHLHPVVAKGLREYLEFRKSLHDREGPLFLTDHGKAYKPGRGTQNKTAFNAMKRRAALALRQQGAKAVREMRAAGRREDAREHVGYVKDRARLIGQITQHWFRHLLADAMLKAGADIRTVMNQGGWLDQKSVIGYSRDVEEYRRQKVNQLPIVGSSDQDEDEEGKKLA